MACTKEMVDAMMDAMPQTPLDLLLSWLVTMKNHVMQVSTLP